MVIKAHNNKGMTLIEVMLTLVLSSLFFCCVMQFVTTGAMHNLNIRQQQELRINMNQLKLFIEEQYQEAEQICIYVVDDQTGIKEKIDVVHDRHNPVYLQNIACVNRDLSQITYFLPQESTEKNKKRIISMVAEEKNGEVVFKIYFQGQTLISNILKIKVNYLENCARLDITLFDQYQNSLSDYVVLDLRYKS